MVSPTHDCYGRLSGWPTRQQPFFPWGYPWQCIGRIFTWTDPCNPNWAWSGSGALVTHNTILTAGHVAPWGADPWMALFVPAYYNAESAVQAVGDKQYVFLPVKDNEGSFTVRQVKLGPASNGFFPVLDGLKMDDEVVTGGSFILKAEAVRQHPEL